MSTEKNGYSGEELEAALYFIEDLFDRLNIPMFLHRSVARDVRDDVGKLRDNNEGVHVIVQEKSFNKFNEGMIRDILAGKVLGLARDLELQETDNGFLIEYSNGVPIHITVVKKKWKYFKNPDTRFYKVTEYLLPNPFDGYWKARGLIK